MRTRRSNIVNRRINFAPEFNPGLWLDKFIAGQNARGEQRSEKEATFKQLLVGEVAKSRVPGEYQLIFHRWKDNLRAMGAHLKALQVDGRVAVGLGAESVLETSVTLHRTYGVPYIPGAALKGLAASYARKELENDEWRKVKEDGGIGRLYESVFGSPGNSGYITFHDALFIPAEKTQDQPLQTDVMTVHHPDYYQGDLPPADWDDPNPVSFLSATGSYLLALSGGGGTEVLISHTFVILTNALRDYGIGAKTSSGYGRAILNDAPMTEAEKKEYYAALQEERVSKLVNEIKDLRGEAKDVKARLREIANSVIKGKQTAPQQARLATAICERVEDPTNPVEAQGSEWYPKMKSLREGSPTS